MIQLLVEIAHFFKTERTYFYLFVVMMCTYVAIFAVRHQIHTSVLTDRQTVSQDELNLVHIPQTPEEIQNKFSSKVSPSKIFRWSVYLFAGAIFLGLWFNTVDLWRWAAHKEMFPAPFPLQKRVAVWGIAEVVKVTLFFFASSLCLNIFFSVFAFLFTAQSNPPLFLVQTLFLDLAAIFFMIWSVRKYGAGWKELVGSFAVRDRSPRAAPVGRSFERHRAVGAAFLLREVWIGIRTYFVILPIFILMLILLVWTANAFSYEPPPHPLVVVFLEKKELSPWVIFYGLMLACILGPLVEELFFRGFFYPALRKYFGITASMVVTASLFAGVHESIFSFLPIFFLGLVLAYLYEKRHNIMSCISLHVLHNAIFIGYFFLVKDVMLK